MYWNARPASVTLRTPNTQVIPRRGNSTTHALALCLLLSSADVLSLCILRISYTTRPRSTVFIWWLTIITPSARNSKGEQRVGNPEVPGGSQREEREERAGDRIPKGPGAGEIGHKFRNIAQFFPIEKVHRDGNHFQTFLIVYMMKAQPKSNQLLIEMRVWKMQFVEYKSELIPSEIESFSVVSNSVLFNAPLNTDPYAFFREHCIYCQEHLKTTV